MNKSVERAKRTRVIINKYRLYEYERLAQNPRYEMMIRLRAMGYTLRTVACLYRISPERTRQVICKGEAIVRHYRGLSEFDKQYLREVY